MSTMAAPGRRSLDLLGLWFVAGLVSVLSFMALLSIGVFIAPLAVGLVVLAAVLTSRRPGSWPSTAGLGLALAAGLAWLGVVVGGAGPSEMTCWGDSTGAGACMSDGKVIDPDAFNWSVSTPWLVAAIGVALLTVAAYAVAESRTRSSAVRLGR